MWVILVLPVYSISGAIVFFSNEVNYLRLGQYVVQKRLCGISTVLYFIMPVLAGLPTTTGGWVVAL